MEKSNCEGKGDEEYILFPSLIKLGLKCSLSPVLKPGFFSLILTSYFFFTWIYKDSSKTI